MGRINKFKSNVEKQYNRPVVDLFIEFANKGMSYHDVAVELEYSETTIRAWANRIGVKLKPCYSKNNSGHVVSKTIKNTLCQSWIKINYDKS